MNNIAEGFERQTNQEFKRFLYISKASSAEVRSMLHLARSLEKVDAETFDRLLDMSLEVSRILSGLIKSLCDPGHSLPEGSDSAISVEKHGTTSSEK
ncbi:MAG: four helix bundle protein [Bacteroidales bacterium]